MNEIIKNRYEFVLLFDVENETLTAILIWVICPGLIHRQVMELSPMFVSRKRSGIMLTS